MTKTELTPENLQDFRLQFGTFHDAVIHDIDFDILNNLLSIKLETKDLTVSTKDQWINLTFEITEVVDLLLKKPRNYDVSVILHLSVGLFDSKVHINFFSSRGSNPDKLESYNPTASPASAFIVVGQRCFWKITPIDRLNSNPLFGLPEVR